MLEHLYLNIRVLKQIDVLKRSGKKAVLAAARAENIIVCLEAHGRVPDSAGSLTKHGELRIKGVRKYDLGSGYRLITLKQRQRLYLLFVGSHDHCDRWLENNRDLPLAWIETRCRPTVVAARPQGAEALTTPQAPSPQKNLYDPPLVVSEKDLRKIFRGLTGDGP